MLFSILAMYCTSMVSAQTNQDDNIDLLLKRIEGLSETTYGLGADAYGGFLTPDFSRWTLGDSTIINYKSAWIEGIQGWFTDGWRVAEREQKIIEISIVEEFAFVRRVVFETYMARMAAGQNPQPHCLKHGFKRLGIGICSGSMFIRGNYGIQPNQL